MFFHQPRPIFNKKYKNTIQNQKIQTTPHKNPNLIAPVTARLPRPKPPAQNSIVPQSVAINNPNGTMSNLISTLKTP